MAIKTFIGTNGSWNTSSNWSPVGVPISTDDIILDNNCTLNVDPASITVNSLTINNSNIQFNINAKTITLTTSAIIKNSSYLTNGNIYANSISFFNGSFLNTDVYYGTYGTDVINIVNAYSSNFYFYSGSYASDYSNLSGNNLYMYEGSQIGRNESSCKITNFAYLYNNSSFDRGDDSISTCLLSAFDTSNVGAIINNTCYFYNSSVNTGYLHISAYFYSNSNNNQYVNIGIFNDYSKNTNNVNYAYFNDYTNNTGTVNNKIYYNNNKLSDASFRSNVPTYFLYTTGGILTLSGTQTLSLNYPQSAYDLNNNVISSYYFKNSSVNYTNSIYNAFFENNSYNFITKIISNFASFKDNTYNLGFITSATFYDNAINYGIVLSNTYFYNSSYNVGYIGNSSIYFNNNKVPFGIISNNTYKLNTIPLSSWYEPAIVYNGTPITTFIFGTSSNNLKLPYSAVFDGSAINTGNLQSNNLYNDLLAFYDFSNYDTLYIFDKSDNKNNLKTYFGYGESFTKTIEKINNTNSFALNLSSVGSNLKSVNYTYDTLDNEFTVCFWILNNDNTNGNKIFISNSPYFNFKTHSSLPYTLICSVAGNNFNIPCTPNEWNFVCVRSYMNTHVNIMLNDKIIASKPVNVFDDVGKRNVGFSILNLPEINFRLNLKLSNLAIYNRAITEDERLYFYNNGVPNNLPDKILKTKAIFNQYSKNLGGSADIIVQNNINKGVNSPQLIM